MSSDLIVANIQIIREKIAGTAQIRGIDSADIQIVAVTKNRTMEEIISAWSAGLTIFGENRIQEALPKIVAPAGINPEWHMIGHLQSNKARAAVDHFTMIQSLDSVELAMRLSRIGVETGRLVRVLVEVNTSAEPSKHGIRPDSWEQFFTQLAGLRQLQIDGLMTVGPLTDDVRRINASYALLRDLFGQIAGQGFENCQMKWLSMGMSDDYPTAIAEGANMIRLGRAIFGPRQSNETRQMNHA